MITGASCWTKSRPTVQQSVLCKMSLSFLQDDWDKLSISPNIEFQKMLPAQRLPKL